jgi:hypothetical protein
MFERVTKPESRWRFLWPDVSDLAGAEEGIKLGYWGAFFVAGSTTILSVLGALGLGLASLFDAAVFGLIGVGLLRKWRSAALVGLILFSVNFVMTVAKGAAPSIVAVFILLGFIGAVRGTFAYHRLNRLPQAEPGQTTAE